MKKKKSKTLKLVKSFSKRSKWINIGINRDKKSTTMYIDGKLEKKVNVVDWDTLSFWIKP